MRKRTLKSSRKKQQRHSKADPKCPSLSILPNLYILKPFPPLAVHHGERARYHYYQCLQLILRLQVAALTRLWKLPPEFEARRHRVNISLYISADQLPQKICRELWALNLSLIPRPPVAEPLFNMHDRDGTTTEESEQSGDPEKDGEGDADEDEEGGSECSSSSPSSSDSDDSDSDSELDRLMQEISESSSSEGEARHNATKDRTTVPTKNRRIFGLYDMPTSTVTVIVLACWTLRLPVMYMDLVRSV